MLSGLHQLKLLRGTPPAEIQLRKRIGRGGVSDLWIASHEAVAHPFIVKYSRHPATQNPYILGQFEREYEASCALSAHGLEHLTTCVFDFDVDCSGAYALGLISKVLHLFDSFQIRGREGTALSVRSASSPLRRR